MKIEACLSSLNEELKKMGKNGKAKFLYQATRDGLSSQTLWEKCKSYKETITLVQTDLETVIGCYCPNQWENTKNNKNSDGYTGRKDIF